MTLNDESQTTKILGAVVKPGAKCSVAMEYQGHKSIRACHDLYNCCDCGGNDCGCRYCFSCNACEHCLNNEE